MIVASLGIGKVHRLFDIIVSMLVSEKLIGNYAFGYMEDDIFVVRYVGRSDSDLKTEIRQQMKTDRAKGCTHFVYSVAESVKDAFEKECRDFHYFGGADRLNNQNHPAKPAGTNYKCPVVGCEYND